MEQQRAADNALVGQDSMELLLWQIEALQARVKKLNHILRKEAGLRRSNSVSNSGVSHLSPRALQNAPQRGTSSTQALPSQKAVPRGGTPSSSAGVGRTSSGFARRKSSDYDINNIVMPVNVGSNYVQDIRHLDIDTPRWRLKEDSMQGNAGQESSSDEVGEALHWLSYILFFGAITIIVIESAS